MSGEQSKNHFELNCIFEQLPENDVSNMNISLNIIAAYSNPNTIKVNICNPIQTMNHVITKLYAFFMDIVLLKLLSLLQIRPGHEVIQLL